MLEAGAGRPPGPSLIWSSRTLNGKIFLSSRPMRLERSPPPPPAAPRLAAAGPCYGGIAARERCLLLEGVGRPPRGKSGAEGKPGTTYVIIN